MLEVLLSYKFSAYSDAPSYCFNSPHICSEFPDLSCPSLNNIKGSHPREQFVGP